jgi:hypothetical protein
MMIRQLLFALVMGSASMVWAQEGTTVYAPLSALGESDSVVEAPAHKWEYLAARYDVMAAGLGQEMGLTLSVRMKRDSIVWFSVQAALGIQVAKGLLRKDSFFLLDLYNKKYYTMPASAMAVWS